MSGEGSMVEAAGVLGARASVLSHCLAPHFTRPDPHRPDYRTWLTTLTTFCNQLDPPLDPEVLYPSQCIFTRLSVLILSSSIFNYLSQITFTFTGVYLISCTDPSGVSLFVHHGVDTSKVPCPGPQYRYCTQSSWGGYIDYHRRNNSNSLEVSTILPGPPSIQDHPQALPQSS